MTCATILRCNALSTSTKDNARSLLNLPMELLAMIVHMSGEHRALLVALACKHLGTATQVAFSVLTTRKPRFLTPLSLLVSSVACLQWAVQEAGHQVCSQTWMAAVKVGNVNALDWLDSHKFKMDGICRSNAFELAAANGFTCVLRWLTIGCSRDRHWKRVCMGAAKGGHLDILRAYCFNSLRNHYEEDQNFHFHLCLTAAKYGQLNTLKWFHSIGIRCNANTCEAAAKGGQLHILKWLHERGCLWHVWTCTAAAEEGHLEVLQWLRKRGAPWDWVTSNRAKKNGHVELLEWAIQNGCPVWM